MPIGDIQNDLFGDGVASPGLADAAHQTESTITNAAEKQQYTAYVVFDSEDHWIIVHNATVRDGPCATDPIQQ